VAATLVDVTTAPDQQRHQRPVPELGGHQQRRALPPIDGVRIHARAECRQGLGIVAPDRFAEGRDVVLAHGFRQ